MIRILFCNISYLPYYNTRLDRVAPKNGGAYVAKMHDAYEKHMAESAYFTLRIIFVQKFQLIDIVLLDIPVYI